MIEEYYRQHYKYMLTNSAIIINDYDKGDIPTLEYNFYTWDPITHTKNPLGMFYSRQTRQLFLPRGIDLYFVKNQLYSANKDYKPIAWTKIDPYEFDIFTDPIGLRYQPKDDRQKEALRFMLCKGRYENNINRSQLSVNLPTGAGKTYCSTATICATGIKSIVITAQGGILEQWKDRILEYSNIKESDICRLEGSATLNRILNNNSIYMDKKIYLVTHSTLKSFGDTFGWAAVGELFKTLRIGIKFYDEAHQNFSNMCMIDFFTNVYKTYYVTATPSRSSSDEKRIYELYMKNIPSIDLFDEDSDPHTTYMPILFNSNPGPADVMYCSNRIYGFDRLKYIEYCTRDTNTNFWIVFDWVFQLIYSHGGRALFYIGTNEAIMRVYNHIIGRYPELVNDIGIYTTLSDDKQEEKKRKYILSTTKSAAAGEDIADLKFSVVVAEPFKSEILARQTLGRTRNPNTYYIELVDLGFKYERKYYYAKQEIFNKYAERTLVRKVGRLQYEDLAINTKESHDKRLKQALRFNIPKMTEAIRFNDNLKNGIQVLTFYNGEPIEDLLKKKKEE